MLLLLPFVETICNQAHRTREGRRSQHSHYHTSKQQAATTSRCSKQSNQRSRQDTYWALNSLMSRGFCRMTSLVHSFKMAGSCSGTLICSAQYNGSTSMVCCCWCLARRSVGLWMQTSRQCVGDKVLVCVRDVVVDSKFENVKFVKIANSIVTSTPTPTWESPSSSSCSSTSQSTLPFPFQCHLDTQQLRRLHLCQKILGSCSTLLFCNVTRG